MNSPASVPPDPLIDEVRRNREALLAEFGYDLRKLGEHLREMERQHPERMATPEQLAHLIRRRQPLSSESAPD